MTVLTEKGHVLVVDDDETIVTIVCDVLNRAGYATLPASSGEEALDTYALNKVDLVITDIRMDGMDGFQLMQRLKLVDNTVNVIVMTGFDSYDAVLKALQSGAYDYLQKPLDNHATLLAAVDRAHSNARLQRENNQLLLQLENSHEKLAKANRRLVEANHKLKRLAATDTLTLMFNRRYLDQVLKRETDRRNRYMLPLSLIMADIDHFKQINDEYGHEAGDNAIKQVATIISECSRTADIAARYGGEEFVVILPQTNPENAKVFAERARRAIEEADFALTEDHTVKLTVSLGISGVDSEMGPVSVKQLLSGADKALYQAKRNGRNCFTVATDLDVDNGTTKNAA